jgi:AcrR family transcriptional regulator
MTSRSSAAATVPSTPKGEASRARILQTAAEVFAAKGYTGATFQDLIAASGMTKGAFYFYFQSKETLAWAVLERKQHEWLQRVTSALEQTNNPEAPGPEATGPEATGPEATGPEATGPEATGPEATGPGAARHEAAGPEAARHEAAGPEAARPEAARHEAAGPEAARPEAARHEAGGPEAARPEAARHEAGGPGAAGPGAARHEAAGPGAAGPGAARPEAARHEAAGPGAAGPGAAGLEAAGPGAAGHEAVEPKAALTALAEIMLDLHRDDPSAWSISKLTKDLAQIPSLASQARQSMRQWVDLVAELIRAAQASGQARQDVDPDTLAGVLVAGFDGLKALHDVLDAGSQQAQFEDGVRTFARLTEEFLFH